MRDSGIVIFGGTAAYHINPADFAGVIETRLVETPYGRSPIFWRLALPLPPIGGDRGGGVWYSSRHGENSLARSARFVNHRANLWAARQLGATAILSWNGVGAINPDLRVGEIVVPAGLMDWTRHRTNTFGKGALHFERAEQLRQAARTIGHIENSRDARQVAFPFAESLRQEVLCQLSTVNCQDAQAPEAKRPSLQSPVYVCTEGPRLETAAEIQLAADLGADVVGMTLCPEVWLAAELGLAYVSLCLVTNFATGRWHIDPRRDFGPKVAGRAMSVLLKVAKETTCAEAHHGE
jgi:5'-methylthioadenosine phosphorylase